ncbi:septal ring lytic transglycosylase RlpA family protein [Sandarakinorhabdus sp.]|uniref:septal ring lytic transglycosylase RlpA family protein n=1 Tax=Sandarakinorhabdus sp. TaxID=1916663 RepID=UPI003F717DFE
MTRLWGVLLAGLLVTACSGGNKPAPRSATRPPPRAVDMSEAERAVARDAAKLGNWPVKIGKPYQVAGITYYPADDRDYREEGIASWYGPGFHASSTANGERYDQDDITAAHRTLPMPSWVEVQNLDNGRRLTVRINDRGPFARNRIIDLSRKSAQLLGVDRAGTARVRLRRVYPAGKLPEPVSDKRVVLAAVETPAVATIALPAGNNSPAAATKSGPNWLVQVAALSDGGRVSWLKGFLSSFGPVLTEAAPGGLTRVRLGPFRNMAQASAALAQVRAAGYGDARLIPPPGSR